MASSSSSSSSPPPPPRPFKKVRFADEIPNVEEGEDESFESTDYRIHFRIRPAYWFMRALGLLIDSEFNQSGFVTLEVTEDGIVVTVRSPLPHCSASLIYQAYECRCFTSSPPLPPRTLYDINKIVQFLFSASFTRSITVTYAPNIFPHQLVFSYRVPPNRGSRQYCANLTLDNYYKFTRGTIFCEFPITTAIVKEMIEHIQLSHSVHQLVTVDVKSEVVKISVGLPHKKRSALWEIKKTSSSPGIKHHALFKLPYLVFIRKAAEMSVDAVMRFSTDPEKQVMLQFFLKEFGELVYSFKPIELDTVPDEDPLSGNGGDSGYSVEASQSSSHAAEASQSSSDEAEASQPAGDAAEASQPAGDAAEALQPGGDAAEASQPAGDAAEASQPGGDAAGDLLPSDDAAWAFQFVGDTPLQPGDAASETSQPSGDAAGDSSDG